MGEFAFKVNVVAVVRVHAADENVARKIIPDVLGAPGAAEIRLVNENHAALGRDATVTDVDFYVGPIKLATAGLISVGLGRPRFGPLAFVINNLLLC
jgi:hypothetical protein